MLYNYFSPFSFPSLSRESVCDVFDLKKKKKKFEERQILFMYLHKVYTLPNPTGFVGFLFLVLILVLLLTREA